LELKISQAYFSVREHKLNIYLVTIVVEKTFVETRRKPWNDRIFYPLVPLLFFPMFPQGK
jgi:hypothetical protein